MLFQFGKTLNFDEDLNGERKKSFEKLSIDKSTDRTCSEDIEINWFDVACFHKLLLDFIFVKTLWSVKCQTCLRGWENQNVATEIKLCLHKHLALCNKN